MSLPTEQQLLAAACHFGHPQAKWNPKMAEYIFGVRRGIHIFDLAQTRTHLERVCEEMKKLQAEGKVILLVSTKQQGIPLVEEMGKVLHQPLVTKKWIPGLLTNWPTLKKRLQYYLDLRRSFQTGEVEKYTKKEQLDLRKKLAKLDVALSGVAGMTGLPHAVFIVDAIRDHVAVLEAKKLGIPVFGICDSNADPDEFTVCIPANDDAVKSLTLIITTIKEALMNIKPRADEEKVPA
ncbi:30S ribosomal protein S2 [Candidatus Peregrinibacteria bacterium]|nr:30S ribosomal protein S2 [Candidatus Peregrinibacteria bacterium]